MMTWLSSNSQERGIGWHIAAAIFLGIQLIFVSSLAVGLKFYERPPLEKYALAALCLLALTGALMALWRLRSRPSSPLRFLAGQDWASLWNFAAAMVLVWLQFVLLTWGKAMLPVTYDTMWADPLLADVEARLLGADAWRLLPGPTLVLDSIYNAWAPTIGAIFAWLFFRRVPQRQTILLAFFLTIGLLGTFGQYLLPSGGPIFYERLGFGNRFAGLVPGFHTVVAADHLWSAYTGRYQDFATGISAFPSIHVAAAAWAAIAVRRWWAYAYLAIIFFGSIILGWHYALDGVAGIAGAIGCYFLAAMLLAPKRQDAGAMAEELA